MIVTPLSPLETIEWFEMDDLQHDILCFLLTADPRHREILRQLVENVIDADTALGEKIAFILYGGTESTVFPEISYKSGPRVFLPGELIKPKSLLTRHPCCVAILVFGPVFIGSTIDRKRNARLSG